jgi:peptide chain release factor 2
LDAKERKIAELSARMNEPDFWKDQARAKAISEENAALAREVGEWRELGEEAESAVKLIEEGLAAKDESLGQDIGDLIKVLEQRFAAAEFQVLFSGKYDANHCIVAFHAGTGGTEAMDWTEMLLRMILRFAERKGLKARIVDESRGGEAGLKSATVAIEGRHAYGWLKSEAGVHRLVRISPFDAERMRHTSFALIEVLPDLGDVEEEPIDQRDLRVDTFLSSGHGGQSVQTTYSAVRLTHLPTGLVVSCQNERSQAQNKETAMRILRAKIHALAEAKREEEKSRIRGAYTSAEWGNQIRSYVLQPYRLVKDHRTGHETADTQAVLDGELEGFVEAYLRWDKDGRPPRQRGKEEE